MSTSVKVAKLPACDICRHPTFGTEAKQEARFDFKTRTGQWANACPTHYKEWRSSPMLGTGRGQLLLLKGESETEVLRSLLT